MKILGIETSCDETAAAVVEDGYKLLSNVVATSMDLHAQYGGVVPEIAARSHIESIMPVVNQAISYQLTTTGFFDPWDQIDGIAVTYGAGLGGSLLIGVLAARTLAITKKKPLYAINHVEAHVYANFITAAAADLASSLQLPTSQPKFPILALIVSGGHSQLVLFRDHFDYTLLGQTHDDAIGEAFDKVAKIIGVPYPGGPNIARKAEEGDPHAYEFPKAQMNIPSSALESLRAAFVPNAEIGGRSLEIGEEAPQTKSGALSSLTPNSQLLSPRSMSYDFSFSGLKTAVLRRAQAEIGEDFTFASKDLPGRLSDAQKANIAASFQRVAIETVVDKCIGAFEEFSPASVVIAGGVAANQELRRQLTERLPIPIQYTDMKLCTDNGAMVATLGCFKAMHGQPTADPYSLNIEPNLSM